MKFNQWTLGLAAVGAVSLASAVRADEAPKMSAVQTALSNTTISGYVDVGANWTLGNQYIGSNTAGVNKTVDGFSLNDVVISLDKPLDESRWASGYHVDLNWGADAIGGYASGSPIRQAYVTFRTPVGNGIDWKAGVLDGITGYEGNTSYSNPNISRSYGWDYNPASYTGLLGTYKISDMFSVTAGVVNPTFQYNNNVSSKSYVASFTVTAPKSWGFLADSAWNFQTIQSFGANTAYPSGGYEYGVNNYSVNGTFNTPIAALKLGVSFDYLQSLAVSGYDGAIYGVYATYDATSKLHLALRGEYLSTCNEEQITVSNPVQGYYGSGSEVTATVQYDLWANVVSRAEIRWDHIDHQDNAAFSVTDNDSNLLSLDLSLVYKF